jgi:L-rhamnose mutarotase
MLDLRDDAPAIAAYRRHHRRVWPEVLRSLRRVGVREMDIYALDRRLVMVMEVRNSFDRRRDFARHVASNPRCAEWERLMRGFQVPPPGARRDEVWARMAPAFSLSRQLRRLPRARRGRR